VDIVGWRPVVHELLYTQDHVLPRQFHRFRDLNFYNAENFYQNEKETDGDEKEYNLRAEDEVKRLDNALRKDKVVVRLSAVDSMHAAEMGYVGL